MAGMDSPDGVGWIAERFALHTSEWRQTPKHRPLHRQVHDGRGHDLSVFCHQQALLSVFKLIDGGWRGVFDEEGCFLMHKRSKNKYGR